jgi:hypothetical protein
VCVDHFPQRGEEQVLLGRVGVELGHEILQREGEEHTMDIYIYIYIYQYVVVCVWRKKVESGKMMMMSIGIRSRRTK